MENIFEIIYIEHFEQSVQKLEFCTNAFLILLRFFFVMLSKHKFIIFVKLFL